MIRGARFSVATLMLAAGVSGWFAAGWFYSERIAVLESHLEFRGDQRDEFQRQVEDLRRVLNPEEAREIQERLSAEPGDVTLHVGEDAESQMIGEQMKTLFEGAGWNVMFTGGYDIDGVEIVGQGPQEQEALRQALKGLSPQSEFMQMPHDGKTEPSPLR